MTLFKKHQQELQLTLGFLIAGQIIFALFSSSFTTPHYEGNIYATTGVQHKQEDLHKLNEAAHYFGQTMIGWLKFPHFFSDLNKAIPLPEGSSISAHIQERQNIIFTLNSPSKIDISTLEGVKAYLQKKLDGYNEINQTKFVLTNVDYETLEIKKSYLYGVVISFMASVVIALGILFIRREFR